MLPPFDIFKSDAQHGVLWVEAVPGLLKARQRIQTLMADSPGEYIILSHETGNRIVFKQDNVSAAYKRRVLQIAYDKQLMQKREALLVSRDHQVTSAFGNEEGKAALDQNADYDLIVIGHAASQIDRIEMADWIKARYPTMMILALNPPSQRQLIGADFNLLLNGPEEWLLVVETASN